MKKEQQNPDNFQREVNYARKRNTNNRSGTSHDFPDRHFLPAEDEDDEFRENYLRWDILNDYED